MDCFKLFKLWEANKALEETVEDVKDFAVEKMENLRTSKTSPWRRWKTMVGANEHIEDMSDFNAEISLGTDATIEYVRTKMEKEETVKLRLRRETFENSAILNRVGERPFLLELLVIVQVLTLMMFVKILWL